VSIEHSGLPCTVELENGDAFSAFDTAQMLTQLAPDPSARSPRETPGTNRAAYAF
jgi:hypothetical protein